MTRLRLPASAAFVATILAGFSAFAQATATGAVGAQGSAGANTQSAQPVDANAATAAPAANQQGMALPTTTAAAQAAGNSDHDNYVGHLAVGYLGRASMPYGVTTNPELPVPVIGVRYWIDPMLGLDLGLGLYVGGTSTDTTTTPPGTTVSTSGPKPTAFMLHAGVPLALASAKHFTFEVIPEANFGYATVSQDATLPSPPSPVPGTTKQTGVHLDIGARAGAEIHFGFMGLPQLSLLGTIGLRFDYDKLGIDVTPPAAGITAHQSTSMWALRTSVYDSPWNIFISNVGALYYF